MNRRNPTSFFNKNFWAQILSYLPGLVVLIFSMIALHSSLAMLREQKNLQAAYVQMSRDSTTGQYSLETDGIKQRVELLKQREANLYWSVIVLGLSGFVLILLNGDRLRKFKILNQEKKEALDLLEKRLAAMEASFDGICIIDKEGRLSYMNKALARLYEILPSQIESYKGRRWLELYGESQRAFIEDNILPEVEQKGHWYGEIPIARVGGGTISTELSLARLPDGGFISTVRDITEKRRDEREREELQGQFYQAQKMEAIGRLAGGIAHDFNNILAAMNGYAEFLVDDLEKNTPQYGFAQSILQAGRQARSLIDQMLTFSRLKESETEYLDLAVPLRESLGMLRAGFPKTIEIVTNISLEKAPINGNETQVSQLIINLCVNARDAMEDDHGTLKIGLYEVDPLEAWKREMLSDNLPEKKDVPAVRIEDMESGRTRMILGSVSKNHRYVCLSVEDTGSGMSRVIMEHIFEPFFTTKSADKGTGLGLSTVHGVIASHRGAMVVDSALGKGTTFELYFPLTTAKPHEEILFIEKHNKKGCGHVLLVEDQPEVRDMMINMLRRLGYETTVATTGAEALDILRETNGNFDLVLTDHNMPKMTGVELVSEARQDFPSMPFILLSGYDPHKLKDVVADHPGIKAVLRKPIEHKVLAQEIQSVLKKKKSNRAVA